MDRRERCEQPFVVGRISRIADADERSVGAEQSAAAAPLHRLASDLDVGGAEILVDRGHAAVVDRRILSAVAADRDNRLPSRCRAINPANAHRLDRGIGEDADQRQIPLQIPGDHLPG